ncbi:MAG: XcyI family restriction endonuclease [bacterium]|nr:XcyI family restriction endonuclease [bacterium]
MPISLAKPDLQIDFAVALIQIREAFLQDALLKTIGQLKVSEIDKELNAYADSHGLSKLASKGLRGEIVFATPIVLQKSPKLIGYYRLLLGYSQKEFYTAETGIGSFRVMEEKGILSPSKIKMLPELCEALNKSAEYLINSLSPVSLTRSFMDDLTLLTLGPQLRGGANVKKGARGIVLVFDAIKTIVENHIVSATPQVIEIKNAAGRKVLIEFAADPDIIIRENMSNSGKDYRNVIAIEVKGGTDFSNIHNRIGEAEKSHQKAKQQGYTECWTIVNVDKIDTPMAKKESPSTNRFYLLSSLVSGNGTEYADFKNRIESLTSIPTRKMKHKSKK